LCNKCVGAYCLSHATDGSLSGKKHDPNWRTNTAPATNLAEGAALDIHPSEIMEQNARTPQLEAGSPKEVDLQFTGDPSPGAWLCTVAMDPEDNGNHRIVGIISTSWTPVLLRSE
jgi:hypothetical protein